MKTKNIILAAILVLAGFSCSMENDTIMNDVEKSIEETTEAYAALDFGVSLNEMATKSTEVYPGTPGTLPCDDAEKTISNATVFIVENNNIIAALKSEEGLTATNVLGDLKFVTKYYVGRTLEVHVVVNGNSFLTDDNLNTKADLNKAVSGCLSASELIKYGSRTIVFGTDVVNPDPSPAEVKKYPETINVEVSHIAARLDFSSFNVKLEGFDAPVPAVKFIAAKFVNIQEKGTIFGDASNVDATGEVAAKIENETWASMTAYSYANTATALYVKFMVGDRTFEKTYPINPEAGNGVSKTGVDHNGVKGGYLYKINVNWIITPKWGDSTIEFYTLDWVHNTIPEITL